MVLHIKQNLRPARASDNRSAVNLVATASATFLNGWMRKSVRELDGECAEVRDVLDAIEAAFKCKHRLYGFCVENLRMMGDDDRFECWLTGKKNEYHLTFDFKAANEIFVEAFRKVVVA